jgi:hypothetical protein
MSHRPDRIFALVLTFLGLMTANTLLAAEPSDTTVRIDGLDWTRASNGENITWPEAVDFCDDLEVDGFEDWRLPSLDELAVLHDGEMSEGIRSPFVIGDCCLWSGESLVDRPAEDGDEIAGGPEMYHWGFMFDGGFPYYAVHIFDDGRALCVRDAQVIPE